MSFKFNTDISIGNIFTMVVFVGYFVFFGISSHFDDKMHDYRLDNLEKKDENITAYVEKLGDKITTLEKALEPLVEFSKIYLDSKK